MDYFLSLCTFPATVMAITCISFCCSLFYKLIKISETFCNINVVPVYVRDAWLPIFLYAWASFSWCHSYSPQTRSLFHFVETKPFCLSMIRIVVDLSPTILHNTGYTVLKMIKAGFRVCFSTASSESFTRVSGINTSFVGGGDNHNFLLCRQ